MSNLGLQIRQAASSVDPIVADYTVGYVQHIIKSTEDSVLSQQLDIPTKVEFLRGMLISAGGDSKKVEKLCSHIESTLVDRLKKNMAKLKVEGDTSKRLLDASLLSSHERDDTSMTFLSSSVDVEHIGRQMESKVDKKKLKKAEAKIARKMAKREDRYVKYEASKLINEQKQDDYDSFYLKVNPLDVEETGGRSKDIKIDSFDLFVGDAQRILMDASLTLAFGHRYGLVGQNGVGKSTLLKALSRRQLDIPKHITILYVEQEYTGDDSLVLQSVLDADVWRKQLLVEEQKTNERVEEIEKLRKEFEDGSPEMKKLDTEQDDLYQNLEKVQERLADIESDKAEGKAAHILYGLGFSEEAQNRPTKEFSGGWRMRLSLARALFCQPDLLLLDEPTNMLDVPSATYLAHYLKTYPSTVLVVSHDREFLNEVATDIIHQHSERLDYYRGSDFDSFYNTREERLKTQKREYENQIAYRKHLQAFIDKFRYNAAKSREAQSRIKKLEKLPVLLPPEQEHSYQFKFPDAEKLSSPTLQLLDVSFGYKPEELLLNHVDLDLQMDSRIAIVGANGCGKTTLLKIALGELDPTGGSVYKNHNLRIGYFAQHHVDALDLSQSAVSWMGKKYPGKTDEEYRRHLGSFGITGSLSLQKMALLSGGQKSRVIFASLCLNNPHILVLDEPTNHLDTAGLDALATALKNFKGGILMVSHDVHMIKEVCHDILYSEDGKVRKFPGTMDDYKDYILEEADSVGVVKRH
ncbi:ATP-binding cassette, regulator of translational elongation [Brettanomyces nanus]|uniref:ATP-binding cassette, regulator of translational elongation n=1 Tax=Eeniella nana TaxID=13502 RepID=A0A875S749_EENNA|nr:ATP-binding cassette, regulator of translational elongation [Brettanomyces nanus]QPG75772.1 ATP-binding cassette, regulator of translational elongation [Brettanomyces nanus]